jgi:hypothetical protein
VLQVGAGEVGPVSPEVWTFSVSGLQVVKSWLDYRMKKGAGKKSSPLDDIRPGRWTDEMTRELLELLWVLEWTLSKYPEIDAWLDEVLAGELFRADEIPTPTDAERNALRPRKGGLGVGRQLGLGRRAAWVLRASMSTDQRLKAQSPSPSAAPPSSTVPVELDFLFFDA